MFLKFFTLLEGILETLHHLLLGITQAIRVFRIYSREIHIQKFIFFSVERDHTALIVNAVKKRTPLQTELRMLLAHLSLDLELNDCDRLVHL